MVYGLYAMRDIKIGFLSPTVDVNDATAVRNFDTMIRKSSDVLHFHKEDFELYKIGSYDTDSGIVTPLDIRELVFEGKDVMYE